MVEFDIDIPTTDGTTECFIAHPDGAGPYPAVVVYMDVLGIREELRDFARRLAAEGYFALLPDLFYREGRVRFDPANGGLEKMFAIGRALTIDMVMRDTQAMLAYLDASSIVDGRTGCIGYCMSGQFVVSAAGRFPDHIRATASLHGTGLVTAASDSPHRAVASIKGEVYLGFAEVDPYVEENVIAEISKALNEAGVAYVAEVHPGTHHAYSFPLLPMYEKAAAEKDWTAMFAMFERQLKQSMKVERGIAS